MHLGNWMRGGEFEQFNSTDKQEALVQEFSRHVKQNLKGKKVG